MPLVLLRLWLPDRPGALGQVASRIGALRGDVVGIDILERGAGRVVDELVVELPTGVPDELLVREVRQVDGVDVEEVRDLDDTAVPDPRTDALDAAASLVEAPDVASVLDAMADAVQRVFAADWVVVIDYDAPSVRVAVGQDIPPTPWLAAFCRGVRGHPTAGAVVAAGDLLCVPLPEVSEAIVVSRDGRPFRAREHRQLGALTTIAATRLAELAQAPELRVAGRGRPS
jgi:hypothetical protein